MIVLALLVAALALLAVGLVTTSAIWFIVSLALSLCAGYLLYRAYRSASASGARSARSARIAVAAGAPDLLGPAAPDSVVPTHLPHDSDTAVMPAVSLPASEPSAHWQVDESVPQPAAEWAAVPADAADPANADTANADTANAVEPVHESAAAAAEPSVWVVDGQPRFHREDCRMIAVEDREPIPLDQAQEDGFVPCSLCAPAVG